VAVEFETFVDAFPEFRDASQVLVEAKIAEATLQVDPTVFRTKTDLTISYLTAHLLSMSSFGQHSRLIPSNAKATRDEALTTYEREYRRLVRAHTSGFRVVSDC
jgi:phage terminase small subunit